MVLNKVQKMTFNSPLRTSGVVNRTYHLQYPWIKRSLKSAWTQPIQVLNYAHLIKNKWQQLKAKIRGCWFWQGSGLARLKLLWQGMPKLFNVKRKKKLCASPSLEKQQSKWGSAHLRFFKNKSVGSGSILSMQYAVWCLLKISTILR